MKRNHTIGFILAAICLCACICAAGEDLFYKRPALFSTCPSETKLLQAIARFGPVGMGIGLVQPTFTMKIHNIEAGGFGTRNPVGWKTPLHVMRGRTK